MVVVNWNSNSICTLELMTFRFDPPWWPYKNNSLISLLRIVDIAGWFGWLYCIVKKRLNLKCWQKCKVNNIFSCCNPLDLWRSNLRWEDLMSTSTLSSSCFSWFLPYDYFLLLYVSVSSHAPKSLWIASSHEHSFCEFHLGLSFSINRKLSLGACNGSCNLHVHVVYLNHNFHLLIAPYLWIQISSQPQMPYINMGEVGDTEPHPGLLYYNFL